MAGQLLCVCFHSTIYVNQALHLQAINGKQTALAISGLF